MHFAYWPPQLNVKVLPKEVKEQITKKYNEELYPWMIENWQKFTGVAESSTTLDKFIDAPYGIKRFKGIINFMNAEDWSMRLTETKEYLNLVNAQRGWTEKFTQVFPLLKDIVQ